MPKYVIERGLPGLGDMRPEELQAVSQKSNAVLAELPRAVQDDTLLATGTKVIALRKDGTSRLLAATDLPPQVDAQYDLAHTPLLASMRDALDTLIFGGGRVMRVFGPIGESDMIIELVMTDDALRKEMLKYSKTMFMLSLLISLITAVLIFVAINRMMIMPIHLTSEDSERIISDCFGFLERLASSVRRFA